MIDILIKFHDILLNFNVGFIELIYVYGIKFIIFKFYNSFIIVIALVPFSCMNSTLAACFITP